MFPYSRGFEMNEDVNTRGSPKVLSEKGQLQRGRVQPSPWKPLKNRESDTRVRSHETDRQLLGI